MIHWKGGESFSSRDIPYNDEVLYAPDCIEKDGKYYLFYSQPGPNPEGTAVADSPYGQFKDGKPVEHANQIDPSVFIDDDGKTFITLEAKVNSNLSGIKPIRMRFHGDADKNLFTINSFRFE